MTWYETLYWLGFVIIPFVTIIIAALTGDGEAAALMFPFWVMWLIFGGIAALIMIDTGKFVVTSTVETVPVSTTLTQFGLDVVTDENQLIRFNEYKDIQAWKDGAKLYKIYSYKKNNFGMDQDGVEIVFKKVEQ